MSKLRKFKIIVFYAQNTCYLFLLKRWKYKKSRFLRIGKKKNAFGKIKYLGRPYCIFSFVAILHFLRQRYFFLTIWEWFERMLSIGLLVQVPYTQYICTLQTSGISQISEQKSETWHVLFPWTTLHSCISVSLKDFWITSVHTVNIV